MTMALFKMSPSTTPHTTHFLARLGHLVTVAGVLVLGACSQQPGAATNTPANSSTTELKPRAYIPAYSAGDTLAPTQAAAVAPPPATATQMPRKRVLFIQGDFIPQSGYPESRVQDDGSKPESFSRLRAEVLESDLQLGVDEFVLAKNTTIGAAQVANYAVVVLGSNARALSAAEVGVLTNYFNKGGSVLTYADSQYGPDNWASDNRFLNQFGIEVLTDNLQPAVDITDVVSAHPVMTNVKAIQAEGISQFRVSAATVRANLVLAKCSPQARSGCILPRADQARVKRGDIVACVVVRQNAKGGRLAAVCDRNLFQNGPGPGSDLNQADDRLFARNLFRWLSKQ